MDPDTESYILLLLADSNLPTGAFVASAGLESYITHGFFGATIQSVIGAKPPSAAQVMADGHIHFLQDNLDSYARSALPFVTDGHTIASLYLDSDQDIKDVEATLSALRNLDALYESMTLNHVARRASRTQGVALLTLYSRGFTHPPTTSESPQLSTAEFRVSSLIDAFKLAVRREDTPGHLPICWAILTAALGLSVARSRHLHLFLQARGVLSAAVRLNTLGPYAAQQLLLHSVRPVVDNAAERCANLHTGLDKETDGTSFDETLDGPANTWPLGEILATRHDLQHSRIFNS